MQLGTNKEDIDRAKLLIDRGCDLIVIDTAHGHSKKVLDTLSKLKKITNSIPVCVGNIATGEAAKKLYDSGADIIKVGIGPGSICTTRMVAGIGVPQISAIAQVKKVLTNKKIKIISDGGIKFSGDIAKAIAAGADAIRWVQFLQEPTKVLEKNLKLKVNSINTIEEWDLLVPCHQDLRIDIFKKNLKINQNLYLKELRAELSLKAKFQKLFSN